MTRREAREAALELLFEKGFRNDETPEVILARALEMREIEINEYVKTVFFGVCENLEFIDALLEKHSHGWKKTRISPVSRAAIRIAIYEMYFCEDVPDTASINEALELVKKYDDADKVKAFVNGVLNAVLKEKAAGGES
ncbi:MAG: transcription antitermination factor NusB [Eubacteriales bacterium]